MRKGDIVRYSHYVKGVSKNQERIMYRFNCSDNVGIMLGYSFIQEGRIQGDPNYLLETKRHKVIVIEPLTNGKRYIEPIRALEEDITIMQTSERQTAR